MIRIHLTQQELKLCALNARKACLGGTSHVRGDDRDVLLEEDQFIGQVGNAAGCKWWYGNLEDYIITRERANANPMKGDGGADLTGLKVDFKTSMMRGPPDPNTYRLVVRPAERHQGWVYVLMLVPKITPQERLQRLVNGLNVYVAGWAREEELPLDTERSGTFQGAFLLPVTKLHPCEDAPCPEIRQASRILSR